MKILILADYLPFNFDLKSFLDKERPDAVFTLGDLKEGQLISLTNYPKPKFGIYGNHCHKGYLERLNIKNMHLTLGELKDLKVFGFQGSIGDKDSELNFNQKECHELLKGAPEADLLMSHCPPFGINDEQDSNSHEGIEALLAYIEKYEPLLVFHGHTYPEKDQELSRYKNSIVVYTHGYRLLDLAKININELPESTFYTPLRSQKGFFDDDI